MGVLDRLDWLVEPRGLAQQPMGVERVAGLKRPHDVEVKVVGAVAVGLNHVAPVLAAGGVLVGELEHVAWHLDLRGAHGSETGGCLLYTSPSPRDRG